MENAHHAAPTPVAVVTPEKTIHMSTWIAPAWESRDGSPWDQQLLSAVNAAASSWEGRSTTWAAWDEFLAWAETNRGKHGRSAWMSSEPCPSGLTWVHFEAPADGTESEWATWLWSWWSWVRSAARLEGPQAAENAA